MKKTTRRAAYSLTLATLLFLSACNTVQGIGKDIQSAGKGLEKGAETVEDSINDK